MNTTIRLQNIEAIHQQNIQNLRNEIVELLKGCGGEIELKNCKAEIKVLEKYADIECICEIDVKTLTLEDDGDKECAVITYLQYGEEYSDPCELFSYDELYNILCNACRTLSL